MKSAAAVPPAPLDPFAALDEMQPEQLEQAMEFLRGLSLALWSGVIVTGRFIAYDWFDCGGDNPAFIDWAAGCLAAP